MIRAAVFDFDGTLAATDIDFGLMRRRAVEVLKRYGAWDAQLEEGRWTLELIEAAAERVAAAGGDPGPMVAEAHAEIQRIELEACERASLQPGAEEAVRRLVDAGVAVAIITRNCAEAVGRIMQRHPLPVTVVLPREHAPAVKPDPRHLLAALSRVNVRADEAALVGDHVSDVQCAKGAGALAVAVASGTSSPEQLREAGADFVAETLSEAVEFLLSQAGAAQAQ